MIFTTWYCNLQSHYSHRYSLSLDMSLHRSCAVTMFKITLCILIFKVHTYLTQFSNHIDLQKAGEVMFNNEKYDLLKPTKHIITDYSKEILSRRRSKNIPTHRIFIDNNGFRHFWSGFGKTIKSLKKTEIDSKKKLGANLNKNMQAYTPDDDLTENINQNYILNDFTESSSDIAIPTKKGTTFLWSYYDPAKFSESKLIFRKAKNLPKKDKESNTKIAKPKKENKAVNVKVNSKVPNTTKTNKKSNKSTSSPKPKKHNTAVNIKTAHTTKPKNKITKNTTTSKTKKVNNAAATKTKTTKSKTKSIKTTATSRAIALKHNATKGGGSAAGDRTVAHTTFFCPFLGVVTMSAFVD